MNRFFLSIGSNIRPEVFVPRCLSLLKEKIQVTKTSSIYQTDPVGPVGKQAFWNCAVQVDTELTQEELLKELRMIENQLGRKRDPNNKYAPRTIDLDILPQKDYQSLAFIMVPLAEIAPEERDPETGKTFEVLAEKSQKEKPVVRKVNLSP